MRNTNEPNESRLRNGSDELSFKRLLAQLRQDQLEAALAGRISESAFYAAEAQSLRDEFTTENALCA